MSKEIKLITFSIIALFTALIIYRAIDYYMATKVIEVISEDMEKSLDKSLDRYSKMTTDIAKLGQPRKTLKKTVINSQAKKIAYIGEPVKKTNISEQDQKCNEMILIAMSDKSDEALKNKKDVCAHNK